jgi:iron complex transport system substrate-binding protein
MKRFFCALLALCLTLTLAACGGASRPEGAPDLPSLTYESTMPLQYADQFAVYRYEGGYSLIDMVNSDRILVVPQGKEAPADLPSDIVTVPQGLDRIYLAATSAMALFEAVGGMDAISFVGSKHWYTPAAIEALASGKFTYAGKYNAPDYELLLHGGCQLAIESTMILHNPEVKDKMVELGIKTVVERSSYENHPLGRTEWMKVYGVLLGREAEAEAAFAAQAEKISALTGLDATGKTAAFFYISTSGNVVTYKTNGYVPAMIGIAGGEYVLRDLGLDDDSKLSTVNVSMEQFYADACDADVVIYNCSIASQLYTLNDFLSLSPVLEDFAAVQSGQVWTTTESMFQQTDKMGDIIEEMHRIFSGTADDTMTYFFRLQ